MYCQFCGCECDDLVCVDCRLKDGEIVLSDEPMCRRCGEFVIEFAGLCSCCLRHCRVEAWDDEGVKDDIFEGILY